MVNDNYKKTSYYNIIIIIISLFLSLSLSLHSSRSSIDPGKSSKLHHASLRRNSKATFVHGPLHMDVPVLANQLIYIRSVQMHRADVN